MSKTYSEREARERRTVCQIFRDGLGLVNVVDAAVCRVVLGLPVPAAEKVVADPLVLEIEGCTGVLCERQRKSDNEHTDKTHNQAGQEKRGRTRVVIDRV